MRGPIYELEGVRVEALRIQRRPDLSGHDDFSDLVDRYCAYGPPARVIERLAEYVEAGASTILFGLAMPPEHRQAGLERFAKDVLPTIQNLTPPRSP